MACVVSHVKHTFLQFEEETSNGFEDDAMVAGMRGSRLRRVLSDSDIRYGGSDSDSDCASRKDCDSDIQTTDYDSGSVSDGESVSSLASLDMTSTTTTQMYSTAWNDLDNTTSSCVAQEVASADSGTWALYCSVPMTPSHSLGLQSWTPTSMAPSEWDSQAAQLRAQAREAEEAAAQLKACLASRANTGHLQSMSVQNSPPSAVEFHTQAAKLTSQAQEAEEAACLMRARARELQSVSVRNSCDAQVPASMSVPTPQAPIPMVPRMQAFPISLSMSFPERAEVSTARELPVVNKQEQASAELTTLMLRNMPNSWTRDMLIQLLDQQGLQGSYDLVFVPVDFRSLASLGYAFVNFTSTENAESAKGKLQGFSSWGVTSQKVCEVAWGSALQGLSAHIKHYRNSPVMHKSVPDSYKPALFKGGVRVAFPSPTKQIRAPRVKAYPQ